MIATLSGQVAEKMADVVVLDVGGVGYGVIVGVADFGALAVGSPIKLYIYEQIKEDAHNLFGFVRLETKQLFEQLLSVKNVGPKVAMSVLDIGTANDVRIAIAGGDAKRLQTAKGVGKRAAEQIVVELRDKVGVPASETAEAIASRSGIDAHDEAVLALTSLGYSDSDAMLALKDIDKGLSTEERVTLALKGASK